MVKWEKWLYLLSFIGGVIVINMSGNYFQMNQNLLNRYNLASLSFREIVYEEFLMQILFLRFKTLLGIWLGTKFFPKRIIANAFAVVMCMIFGGILGMAILENSIWGIWFFCCALVPQIIFYLVAFVLWKKQDLGYVIGRNKKEKYLEIIVILVWVVLGCICEAFISPVVIENVIKY